MRSRGYRTSSTDLFQVPLQETRNILPNISMVLVSADNKGRTSSHGMFLTVSSALAPKSYHIPRQSPPI